jgi:hypothetical protein
VSSKQPGVQEAHKKEVQGVGEHCGFRIADCGFKKIEIRNFHHAMCLMPGRELITAFLLETAC